jgi:predicted glycosyltransferase
MCGDSKNVYRYKGIKEWSYLSPDYFSPNINILSHYKVIPKEYLFVREVDTGSLNYIKQTDNVIASISDLLPRSLKVIFSLENKEKRRCYPQDWILLEEPLSDIFSLIYYSKILISSGDSMAREGAVLGVPSIYCGIRKMAVNKILQEKGVLFHVDPREVPVLVKKIIDTDSNAKSQEGFRCQLSAEWDNVTGLIVNEVENIFSGHA